MFLHGTDRHDIPLHINETDMRTCRQACRNIATLNCNKGSTYVGMHTM